MTEEKRVFIVEMQDGEKWLPVSDAACWTEDAAEWHLRWLRIYRPEKTFRAVPYIEEAQ